MYSVKIDFGDFFYRAGVDNFDSLVKVCVLPGHSLDSLSYFDEDEDWVKMISQNQFEQCVKYFNKANDYIRIRAVFSENESVNIPVPLPPPIPPQSIPQIYPKEDRDQSPVPSQNRKIKLEEEDEFPPSEEDDDDSDCDEPEKRHRRRKKQQRPNWTSSQFPSEKDGAGEYYCADCERGNDVTRCRNCKRSCWRWCEGGECENEGYCCTTGHKCFKSKKKKKKPQWKRSDFPQKKEGKSYMSYCGDCKISTTSRCSECGRNCWRWCQKCREYLSVHHFPCNKKNKKKRKRDEKEPEKEEEKLEPAKKKRKLE